jgi:cytochrome c oxidase assembly factor CtaG
VQWLVHWPAILTAAEAHPVAHAALHLVLLDVAIVFWLPLLGRQPLPRPVGSARAVVQLLLAMPLVDLISVPYVATGRGEAAAAMVASMVPLGIFAVGIAWRGLLREEHRMLQREAVS